MARFNTQPPEGGWGVIPKYYPEIEVSTHSRPKAAGLWVVRASELYHGFNTQPPEGGWSQTTGFSILPAGFNTQPPEGGWVFDVVFESFCTGFNTQPPEGGWFGLSSFRSLRRVSTHSRPKAAGSAHAILSRIFYSFNTQPPEGGWFFRLRPNL